MSGPWEFDEAQEHLRMASALQRGAEEWLKEVWTTDAHAEAAYLQGLAEEILRLINEEKRPVTLAKDLAKGSQAVIDLLIAWRTAQGVKELAIRQSWRRASDRKDADLFAEWSMRRNLAEGNMGSREPAWSRS